MTREKNETAVEKENRQKREKEIKKKKREADETEEQRTNRLQRDMELKRKKIEEGNMPERQNETDEQREIGLDRDRERKKRKREAAKAQDADLEDEVFQKEFEAKMEQLRLSICDVCKRQNMAFSAQKTCDKCSKKPSPNLFNSENRMEPGIVPQELFDLTPLEELLIAKVHPVLSVYKTKGQQLHYEGHVIDFPQDVKSFSRRLPNVLAGTNSIITVRKTGLTHSPPWWTVG